MLLSVFTWNIRYYILFFQRLVDGLVNFVFKVEPELVKLTNEKKVNEAELKKKIGILCYLENLRKDGSSTPICPVCRNDLTDKVTLICYLSQSKL